MRYLTESEVLKLHRLALEMPPEQRVRAVNRQE